jgi:hypothetical protein
MSNEIQVLDTQASIQAFQAQERAAIDTQVATAKQYPRDLLRVRNNSIAIVCMDKETAQACRYAKPVGGKNVVGASVHLARIVAQQYGNIRVQQRIKNIDSTSIVAEAVAFDMETNYAVSVEARRSIVSKNGQRYSDSVIETNAMAILAIAERNAILKIIPKSIIDAVYNEAFTCANGDLSDKAKLIIARDKALDFFKTEYGATEKQVITLLGLKTKDAIKPEHIADLRGYMQSLKDKEVTVEDLFKPEIDEKKAQQVAEQFAEFEEVDKKVDKKTGEIKK